uniref:Uncharacterized protein n=1 Tax=Arundo donax TaxID=35708 RepID=A0A0A9FPB1_ARUDO
MDGGAPAPWRGTAACRARNFLGGASG